MSQLDKMWTTFYKLNYLHMRLHSTFAFEWCQNLIIKVIYVYVIKKSKNEDLLSCKWVFCQLIGDIS